MEFDTVAGPAQPPTATPSAKSAPVAAGDGTQPSADRQLDVARAAAWIDGIARDIAVSAGSDGSARFSVSPANLGTVHVAVTRDGDRADVAIVAASADAGAILSDAKDRLIADARAHGIEIRHATVETGSDAPRADARPEQPTCAADSSSTLSLPDRGYGGGVGTGDTPGRRPQQPRTDWQAETPRAAVRAAAGDGKAIDDGLYA